MSKQPVRTFADKSIFALLQVIVVLTTLAYGTVHQPTIAVFYFLTAVIVICWGVDALQTGVFRFSGNLVQVPVAGAVIYAFVQIIPFGTLAEVGGVSGIPRTISLEPFWTQMFALHILALLLILSAALVFIDSAARLRKMVGLVLVFGFIFAFFAILQNVLNPTKIYGVYEVEYARPFGSFVNRHNFAAFIEMSIALPVGVLAVGAVPRDKRLIYLTAIGLMGVSLIMSGSRGGFVSLAVALIFLFAFANRSQGRRQLVIRSVLAVVLVGIIIVGAVMIGDETSLTRFAETAASGDIATNRTHIWNVTLQVISNHWLLGAGIGSFAAAYTPFDTLNGMERVEQAHNDYLQILADAGIVGAVLVVFFIVQIVRTGLKNVHTDNVFRRGVALGAVSACIAMFVHSLFDFVLHTTAISVMFMLMTALVVVSGRRFDDDEHLYERRHRKSANVTSIEDRRAG